MAPARLFSAICFAAVPFAAVAQAPTVHPSADFQGIEMNIGGGGKVITFAGARQIGDKLAICGLVFFDGANGTAKALEGRFLEHMQFKMNGKAVHVQTALFNRFPDQTTAQKGLAACSVTNTPWDPAFAKMKLEMHLPSETITY